MAERSIPHGIGCAAHCLRRFAGWASVRRVGVGVSVKPASSGRALMTRFLITPFLQRHRCEGVAQVMKAYPWQSLLALERGAAYATRLSRNHAEASVAMEIPTRCFPPCFHQPLFFENVYASRKLAEGDVAKCRHVFVFSRRTHAYQPPFCPVKYPVGLKSFSVQIKRLHFSQSV